MKTDKIDANQAAELACDLVGGGTWSCRPFGAGKFSQTFEAVNQDGQSYVLRIAPPDDMRQLFYEYRMMRQEPALHRRLQAETRVPVPPILAYDFSRRKIDRDYLIMPKLSGLPLSEANLSPAARAQALREWGEYVAQIHGLQDPQNRFGYLGEHHCMDPCPTWAEAFTTMMRRELDDTVATGIYSSGMAEQVMALLENNLAVFESCRQSRLLHGDLWVTNLLVAKDGAVTGVIDFDRACWGDVEWDLAIAEYCGVTAEPFWQGYGSQLENKVGEAAVRRFFYLLYEHQKYIVISISSRHDNPARAQRYADDCRRAVENFRTAGRPVF